MVIVNKKVQRLKVNTQQALIVLNLHNTLTHSRCSCFNLSTANMCQQIEDLCTQICVPTDKSYACKCHDGYELLEDNITCVKITNVDDNEIKLNDNETTV